MKHRSLRYITIPELAKILGVSRIAIFKKVKSGEIEAVKIGRNYAIPQRYVDAFLGKTLNERDKREIDATIKKIVREYGETLKLLGKD